MIKVKITTEFKTYLETSVFREHIAAVQTKLLKYAIVSTLQL